jgi:hypothetical protein
VGGSQRRPLTRSGVIPLSHPDTRSIENGGLTRRRTSVFTPPVKNVSDLR